MEFPLKVLAGYILDRLMGDPYLFPHPVRFIGNGIELQEKLLRKIFPERLGGIILVALTVAAVYFLTSAFVSFSIAFEIVLIYTIFAVKGLGLEAGKVFISLERGNLEKARKDIAFLVSRDTANMDREDVIRATVETVSENIVDGIIAPLFYLFIGGVPLAMAYKAVNTIDSMIGYKNERYKDFGWAGARLDDLANFLPARITAFVLFPVAAFLSGKSPVKTLKSVVRFRHNHDSPNSGHPEAAMAGALECRLGGPVSYFGKVTDKPVIGDGSKKLTGNYISESIRLLYTVSNLGLCFAIVIWTIIFYCY